MKVFIEKGRACGAVKAPPAKSFAHRMLICASLADSFGVIRGIYGSEDVLASIDCCRALCADVRLSGDTAYVTPSGGSGGELDCRESGSTLRFFIPVCLVLGQRRVFRGSGRLMQRPLGVYEELCRERGFTFEKSGSALTVGGRLTDMDLTVDGSVSSQFVTGLMLAAPLTGREQRITLEPPVVSLPYIEITRKVMERYGVKTEWEDEKTIRIDKGSYRGIDSRVEGDWSNAAFLFALGLFGDVMVTGLDPDSVQGDRVCVRQLESLRGGYAEIDITDCPDNGPVLMAAAAALHGARLTGTSRLRAKESDRGEAMAAELRKFGAEVTVFDDEIEIKSGIRRPDTALYGHNDHRVVMALSVLLTLTGGAIEGAEAVNKSYPGFFGDLEDLGIGVGYET